ncbi:hypothetical protein F1189_18450 [Rhodovastum atsumiense]|uniref:Uncharacterized protein n=1 Tax=Rhodovastum atsumiense TaxID=504468 RepID=A0A5M6IQT2_9PROT|nr:hypothetical protein F1189_18450 [Rhodovastum atsumiense]
MPPPAPAPSPPPGRRRRRRPEKRDSRSASAHSVAAQAETGRDAATSWLRSMKRCSLPLGVFGKDGTKATSRG